MSRVRVRRISTIRLEVGEDFADNVTRLFQEVFDAEAVAARVKQIGIHTGLDCTVNLAGLTITFAEPEYPDKRRFDQYETQLVMAVVEPITAARNLVDWCLEIDWNRMIAEDLEQHTATVYLEGCHFAIKFIKDQG